MAYSTQQDLIDRFGETELIQLTDRYDVGAIDADVLGRAMDRGASLIDAKCRGRYQIPLAPVDPIIIDINCDLARHHLYDDQASDQVEKNHAEAIKLLDSIGAGHTQLIAAAVATGASGGSPQFDNEGRIFSRDSLDDF